MQSHCLFHQERVATHRCVSCSKPLCDSCIQSYPDGTYCSSDCHDKAAEASVRLDKIKEDEKALAAWKQRQLAFKIITYCVIGLVLFFGWDHLPTVITHNVEKYWGMLKATFK